MTSPSGPRAPSRPTLEVGDLLANRYRLVRGVTAGDDDAPSAVWQATDEVLARRVAVKTLPASGRTGAAAARPFLQAAGWASSLSHPGLARVFDAALEERPAERTGRTVDVAYVISEWVEGRTLADLLRTDGPLDPLDAVRFAHEAASALGAAHAARVAHGRVHPGNLMVTTAGRLTVTDAAVAAAVHGSPLPVLEPGDALGGPEIARDTRDLAAVVYAMLTARWPAASTPQPSAGLPNAPRPAGGALYAPRQVRAGVPRSLDAVVVRALEPGREPGRNPITTPRALAQALDEAGPDLRPAPGPAAAPPSRRRSRRRRRMVPKLVVLAALVGIGVVGYTTGKNIGELPRKDGALDALAQPTPSPGATGAQPVRINLSTKPIVVRDFDPEGRDGAEQPGTVPNAIDGDPTTAWQTDGYGSAEFGGLKKGVGLLVDLGTPTRLANVQVGLLAPGADIELRSSDAAADTADAFTVVARASDAKLVTTLAASARPARYWLVWFTALPKGDRGRFRDGVAELVFNRAAA